jgi:hypothetical protein
VATDPTKLYEQFQPPERLTLLIEAMARDDAAEAQRLHRTCPRATYTAQDPQFEDRWDMAFDIMAVVNIDLWCLCGKLRVMRCALGGIRDMAVAHRITAALAFIDGERCGKGLPQCEFFAKPLPEPEAEETAPEEDENEIGDDDADPDVDKGDDDEVVVDPSPGQIDHGRRMDAVERRVEHFTTSNVVELLCVMEEIAKDLVNTWVAFGAFCRTRLGVSPETMMKAWQFPLDDFLETLRRYDKTQPDPAKVKEYLGYICKQWDRRFRPKRPGEEFITYRETDDDEGADPDEEGGSGG